ncbi:MAG TPA: MerR family transcriptional regulator [Actinobacteria bacterium]|nr:MerR family transcriptional regulator [Actinomycetota bacterium]
MPKSERKKALFMISVAANLAGMHPQTLRIYEQKGLITPARTPRNTRLYSEEDIERLLYIQTLTTKMGMNLAGVDKVLELEERINRMKARIDSLKKELEAATSQLTRDVEAVHRSYRRELIPFPKTEVIAFRKRR